jgi:hypothetical protein
MDQATISWHAKSNKDCLLNPFISVKVLHVNLGNQEKEKTDL